MKSCKTLFFAVMGALFITLGKDAQSQPVSPQGFSIQNNSRHLTDEEIKDPVLLFEKILKGAVQTDKDAQRSLASIYKKVPEQSTHQKNIKRVLADKFQEKFNVKIEEVVLVPEQEQVVEAPKPTSYKTAIWGSGAAAALATIAALFGHYAMRQADVGGRQAQAAAAQRSLQQAWRVGR